MNPPEWKVLRILCLRIHSSANKTFRNIGFKIFLILRMITIIINLGVNMNMNSTLNIVNSWW